MWSGRGIHPAAGSPEVFAVPFPRFAFGLLVAMALFAFGGVANADAAPVLISPNATTPLQYAEGDGAVPVDPQIQVASPDPITGATVTIGAGYEQGVDFLGFIAQSGITGSYNPVSGVLTLTGESGQGEYTAALQSVTFSADSPHPATANARHVSFTVTDNAPSTSNTTTRDIAVTSVDDPPALAPGTFGSFELKWGSQLQSPTRLALDASGNVYVNDLDRVQKFDPSGVFIGPIGSGPAGTGAPGTFHGLQGLAVGGTAPGPQYVYAADRTNQRVQKFGLDGSFVSARGGFTGPSSVAVDGSGSVYVLDNGSHVHKLDSSGAQVTDWFLQGGVNGLDMAVDGAGSVYVLGSTVNADFIQKYDSAGSFITEWDADAGVAGEVALGMDVDPAGNVYVVESNSRRVAKFTSSGALIGAWGSSGAADGQFDRPRDVAVDSSGAAFVTDDRADRIQRFGPVPLPYTEGGAAVAVDPLIDVTDVDSTMLTGATVKIGAGFGAGDVLASTPPSGITGSFSGDTLTLSGTATVAQYQSALRSVTYQNTSEAPSGATRQIAFTVTDASLGSSPVTRPVVVTPVDDAPVLQSSGGATAFAEDSGPVTVDGGLTAADVDSSIVSGQVRIAAGFQAGDALSFTAANGITGAYDSGTGVLTLTGAATPAQYQEALRSVQFSTPSQSPGSGRTVEFKINDGALDSNAATKDIAVTSIDDLPTAVADSKTVTAGSGATSLHVLANDTDVDGGPEAVGAVTQPAHGTAAITGGGTDVTYKPTAKYCNSRGATRDTFRYTLNGGSEATVTMKVTCPNLKITHPDVNVTKNRALIGLQCKGAASSRCAGTVALLATNRTTRVKAAAAKTVKFSVAGGKSKFVRMKVPAKSRAQLKRKHKAVAQVVVRLTGGGVVKRYITLHGR
jgi:hypothetical protein